MCRAIAAMLKRSGRKTLDLRLFERGDRIGGRLWSLKRPDLPGLPMEMGGMGFSPVHQNVFGLVRELGFKPEPFSPFDTINYHYIRGHRLTAADYGTAYKVPFQLERNQQGKDPDTIYDDLLDRTIPGLKTLCDAVAGHLTAGRFGAATTKINELKTLLRGARAHIPSRPGAPKEVGSQLHEVGVVNLFLETIGWEAYQLCQAAAFSKTDFVNFNLYDAVLGNVIPGFSFDYPSTPPFWNLAEGFDALPQGLVTRFQEKGGRCELGCQLHTIDTVKHNGETLLVLTLGPTGGEPAQKRRLYCRNVVLALPRRSLELLEPECVINTSPQFRQDLHSVQPAPATKLFLVYEKPWWEKDGELLRGYSTTDLPLVGTYYFSAAENGKGLLLASLADGDAVAFWEGYRPSARWGTAGRPALPSRDGLAAPGTMMEEARRQLAAMHGCDVPEAIDGTFFNWGDAPFGGGWHNWNVSVKSWEVMPRIRRPVEGLNVFVCGEAYSSAQGWVEGAVNTAEMVVEKYFDLPRPGWVLPEYDFGP
jgi:monoamine oxidase